MPGIEKINYGMGALSNVDTIKKNPGEIALTVGYAWAVVKKHKKKNYTTLSLSPSPALPPEGLQGSLNLFRTARKLEQPDSWQSQGSNACHPESPLASRTYYMYQSKAVSNVD